MKQSNNNKNANVSVSDSKGQNSVVKEIILSDAVKKIIEKNELKEVKERENLYKYPETINTEKLRNGKEGKAFRNSLRRKMQNFANQILIFANYNRLEDLHSEVKKFDVFYTENYRINNYELNSVSQSNKTDKTELISAMFTVIKQIKKLK